MLVIFHSVVAYHLAKKFWKFRFKVKLKSNFAENPFGNCRLPPDVVLFFPFGTEQRKFCLPFAKLSSFQSLMSRKDLREMELQMLSAISYGWFADNGKTLTIIQRSYDPTGLSWQMVSTPFLPPPAMRPLEGVRWLTFQAALVKKKYLVLCVS